MRLQDYRAFNTLADVAADLLSRGAASTMAEARAIAEQTLPLEREFQSAILRWLKKQPGVYAWKVQASGRQRAGIPDVLAVKGGTLYAFEVKRPFVGRLSDIQAKAHADMRAAGARVYVVSYVSEVQEALEHG